MLIRAQHLKQYVPPFARGGRGGPTRAAIHNRVARLSHHAKGVASADGRTIGSAERVNRSRTHSRSLIPGPNSPYSISRLPAQFDKSKNRFAFQMLQTGKCVSGCDSPIRADQDFPPYRLCDFKVERQEPLKPTGRRISAPNQERAPNGIEKTSSMSLAPGRSTSIFRPRSGRMAANDRCAATRRRCMLPQCQPA